MAVVVGKLVDTIQKEAHLTGFDASIDEASYRNRVWDVQVVGADKSHYWTTVGSPDPNGMGYDGPGTWGVDTSDFSTTRLRSSSPEEAVAYADSTLWVPPEIAHEEDDEFDRGVLDSAWYNYSVPAGDYGTITPGAVDLYDQSFTSGDALRVNVNTDHRRSWALLQPPQNRFMIFGKAYAPPDVMLVMARLKFNMYSAGATSGDRHVGLMFQGDDTGKPDWNNRINMYLNLQGSGTVRASMFLTSGGSDSGHLYTTDVDSKGQALEYVAIHKFDGDYHGWVGTASGNWLWMGAISFGVAMGHVTIGLYTVSNNRPGVTAFGIDFMRFYETSNFLF